jgi:imidazolonepropionase
MTADLLIKRVNLATCDDNDVPFGAIHNSCVAVKDGKIVSIGEFVAATQEIDAQGAWLTPGLIDCHTHLLFDGDRAEEFDSRLRGVSYTEIAQRGGGIRATMNATRAATEERLLALGRMRSTKLLREGVTTLEMKSGYGLDLASERKLLRVATQLQQQGPQHLVRTFLGAHALPPEFADKDSYIDYIIAHMLPALAAEQLVDALDVFCEGIEYSKKHLLKNYKKENIIEVISAQSSKVTLANVLLKLNDCI